MMWLPVFRLALVLSLIVPTFAPAQERKVPVVAVLMTRAYPARLDAFRSGLTALGHEEGRTVTLVSRSGPSEQLDALAAELARQKPDVLVGDTAPTTQALLRATSAIPIVFMATADPVGAGFVKSLAHPGGNVTGLSEMTAELTGKRLQLLREMRPGLKKVAALANPEHAFHDSMVQDADKAARQLDIQLVHFPVRNRADIVRAFAAMKQERVQAVLNLPHPLFGNERELVATLALRQKLPSSVTNPEMALAGGLSTYSPDYTDQARRAAVYVDKILKGAKPADLPVERPTRFELVINMKTARALGLELPQSLLLRADRLIQ